ncbi:MAG: hypothetical protein ACI9S8_002321 [Chlamydiales bacterium]|jgi:hypothetical protein
MSYDSTKVNPFSQSYSIAVSSPNVQSNPSHQLTRSAVTTPFAIQVIEDSIGGTDPSVERESSPEGARVVATPDFFRDLQEIAFKYGFLAPNCPTPPMKKSQILFSVRQESKAPLNLPPPSAPVDLSDISLNLKDGSNRAWDEMFQNSLEELAKANSAENLKNNLRKLLVNFYFDNRLKKKAPSSFSNLLTDFRINSLSYLQKKYFPIHGRMRAHSSSFDALDLVSSSAKVQPLPPDHTENSLFKNTASSIKSVSEASFPSFVTTLLQVFNNETPIDIAALYKIEQEEIVNDILENQCSNRVVKKDEALRLLIHLKTESREKKGGKFNAHVLSTEKLAPFLKIATLQAVT